MGELLITLLKASVVSLLLYAAYMLLLRKLSFFSLNRLILLAIIPISLIVALNPIQTQIELPITPIDFEPVLENFILETDTPTTVLTERSNSTSPINSLFAIYLVGLVIMLFIAIRRVLSIAKLVRKSLKTETNGVRLIEVEGISPSSFFKYIFISANLEPLQKQVITAHEQSHYQKLHSLDILVYQLYKAIFWFNPIVFLLEKELKQVHEYQVDKKVISSEIEKSHYLECLVNAITFPKLKQTLTHQFYNHPLKNRIKMISKSPSKPVQLFKYAVLLIAIAFSAYAFSISETELYSSKSTSNSISSSPNPTTDPNRPYLFPIKDYTKLASPFGYRFHPITKDSMLHKGVDFKAPKGTPVYATANGVVTFADTSKGYGIHILIRNSDVYETHFAHLSEMLVKEGEKVEAGQLIAKVGGTGLTLGYHLHYEVLENGEFVDPALFMPKD
jgi:murein DD-endopeptidase MepM/ murein hydrolase activator NlpD